MKTGQRLRAAGQLATAVAAVDEFSCESRQRLARTGLTSAMG